MTLPGASGAIQLHSHQKAGVRRILQTPNTLLAHVVGAGIANSMAEMFTMQRYLQADRLKKHNLHHFDSWAATFGEPVTAMELSPDGAGYRLNTRSARFINVPELMQMFRQSADVQTAAMLNLPRPELEGEKPAIRNIPATPELKAFVQELAARADRLKTGRVDPSEDRGRFGLCLGAVHEGADAEQCRHGRHCPHGSPRRRIR